MKKQGKLYFLCGKMGAGKSTKAKQLAIDKHAVLLSEDEWLSSIYPNQIESFEDYLKFSAQIKPLVKKHVQNILRDRKSTRLNSSHVARSYAVFGLKKKK